MLKVTVLPNRTIYDIALNEYKSLEGVFYLQQDNPTVVTSLDTELRAGTVLFIDETKKKNVTLNKPEPKAPEKPRFTFDKTTYGQTIYDLAIQHYGNVGAVRDIIDLNGFKSLDSVVLAGTIIKLDTGKLINKEVVDYFESKQMRINTHDQITGEGIGYWGIEFDFKVS